MFRLDRRDKPTDPPDDGDDARFQQSLARLTAQLATRQPRPAAGSPPLRADAPPKPPSKPEPRAATPQEVVREVVRQRAPDPPRAAPSLPPPPAPIPPKPAAAAPSPMPVREAPKPTPTPPSSVSKPKPVLMPAAAVPIPPTPPPPKPTVEAARPEAVREPPLRSAAVDPPPAVAPQPAPVLRRKTGWAYAVGWSLGIGVGAVAAGAFVGFLVNGAPGQTPSPRAVADVAPPTPDVPPPTAQEIINSKSALATPVPETPAPAATAPPAATTAAPAPNPTSTASMTAAQTPPPPVAQAPPPSPSLPGSDVREVQGRLRALGFNPGPVDGSAGPQTTTAVKQYQQAHGLSPTGAVDHDVLAALRREPGATPPPAPQTARPRSSPQYANAPPPSSPPRQRNDFLDALDRMLGR